MTPKTVGGLKRREELKKRNGLKVDLMKIHRERVLVIFAWIERKTSELNQRSRRITVPCLASTAKETEGEQKAEKQEYH